MLVSGQDFNDERIRQIQALVEANPTISRQGLSLQVCRQLGWKSPNGRFKEMSCRVALLKLQRRGILKLPPPHAIGCHKSREPVPPSPVARVDPIGGSLEELGRVDLVRIDHRRTEASKTWTALMAAYHYLGAGPLCGAQMRYLIRSASYGWLGGLAFSAAAWRLEPRDRWIGWSDEARREHLPEVVGNSRFLILPQVDVPNLASHVLSLAAGRLARDWLERYGLAPVLLETFVERGRFPGTCYRAANWQYIGLTRGRGRQDRGRAGTLPVKDIYVYPLVSDFREVLQGSPQTDTVVVQLTRKRDAPAEDWAEEEFGQIELGDRSALRTLGTERRTKRLVTIVGDFWARPERSIPQACQSLAKTKAAYRFFDHPEIAMEKILQPHYEATLDRLKEEKIVLAVQDTTSLNYTAHPATENLGPIGYRLGRGIGLMLHSTMAFNPDGIPLGLLDAQCWARDPEDFGKKRRRHQLPIEQKESHKWLVSLRQTAAVQKWCPGTTFVSVGDREADIYELFELALGRSASGPLSGLPEGSRPHLLVRAIHDRVLGEKQGHLWPTMAQQKVSGIQELRVPRKKNQPSRVARMEVRFAEVSLKPPKQKAKFGELTIWAILAREANPPDGVDPLEWLLLTTMAVTTFEQAVEKLAWYAVRWKIEVFHKTLKSGCKIEERRLGNADRLEACLAIDMVVAWRIVHLTILGRKTPNVPCTVFFEEAEWKALAAYVTQNPVPPDTPPTLWQAVRMVARLGGHLGRKGDGDPGTKSLWTGLQRLDDLASLYKVLYEYVPHNKKCTVSSDRKYG